MMRVIKVENVHGSMEFSGSIPQEFLERLQVSGNGEILITTRCKFIRANVSRSLPYEKTELQFVAKEATLQVVGESYSGSKDDIANASEICKPRLSKEEEGAFW
ncbi:MAG: hypothetical protein Q8910_04290 [Bacteroidota bacterium]|nr:hypothetical protein [Bacteroidota bacterium]